MKLFYNDKWIFYHLRAIVIIIISICLIIFDQHYNSFKKIRSFLETYINSLYFFNNYFQNTFNNITNIIINKNQLIIENKILKQKFLLERAKNLILEDLKHENDKLYSLLKITTIKKKKFLLTTVIANNHSIYHDQIIIDKGSNDGVYEGQPIINSKGIVGQILTINKYFSRVLLICNAMHTTPIKLLHNNNAKGIAIGTGCDNELKVHMISQNDLHIGDIIVSSGLGDRYPEGYQVGTISSIEHNIQKINKISISAKHFINHEKLDYLLLYWTNKKKISDILLLNNKKQNHITN